MKTLVRTRGQLRTVGRWDIDFHLPAEGIRKFPADLLRRVDEVADFPKGKRDPTRRPDVPFRYIDIAAVDVVVGSVINAQDVEGVEAPLRARKVVQAFDVLVSTVRPTRGAICVVPVVLHDQIASTGFTVLRTRPAINPFYLHYALRLPSTLEQFRKWSTGSSYPAILDSDVAKTLIPVPGVEAQEDIAERVVAALRERERSVRAANSAWHATLADITRSLSGDDMTPEPEADVEAPLTLSCSASSIRRAIEDLPPLTVDAGPRGNGSGGDSLWDAELATEETAVNG